MAVIKKAKVKRSTYRDETSSKVLLALIAQVLAAGMIATLFKDPAILAAYYASGVSAKMALDEAINDLKNKTHGGSIETIEAKMALVVIWLDGYADQVEVISNDPANRTTQEEAVTNIGKSGLTAQKIGKNTKGEPIQPEITGKYTGSGVIKIDVANSKTAVYTSMTVIAVSILPVTDPPIAQAVVKVLGDQIMVSCAVAVQVLTKTIKGHPILASFAGANSLTGYNVYCITQNGVKLVSPISVAVPVIPVPV